MEYEPDVLCINCEDLISSNLIEAHSQICLEPSLFIIKLEYQDSLKFTNFKLDKLKCNIQVQLESSYQRLRDWERMILQILIKHISKILKPNLDPVSESLAVVNDLEEFLQTAEISPYLVLYIERLKLLASEQSVCFRPHEFYTKKFINEERKQALYEIRSGYASRASRSALSSILSGESEEETLNEWKDFGETLKSLANEKTREDLERFFYEECLARKLSFSRKNPSNAVEIKMLYEKALRLEIPVEEWVDFIEAELLNG